MRRAGDLLVVVVVIMALAGCAPGPGPLPQVTLETPANGSSVTSLTPVLSWDSAGAGVQYRVQVATESRFYEVIIDEANLSGLSYAVPSGKLTESTSYHWRVEASKGSQTSGWSSYRRFQTPAPQPPTGTITVNATLDGATWTGPVSYTLAGPETHSGSEVAQTFSNAKAGSYTLGFSSGGPSGATLSSIAPSAAQSLAQAGAMTFTLNFRSVVSLGSIHVNATLDGAAYAGPVNYALEGPHSESHSAVPYTFDSVPLGSYSLVFKSGGPSGAALSSIMPAPTQDLPSGGSITFTLSFDRQSGGVQVRAELDGNTWSGPLSYSVGRAYKGSRSVESYDSVPYNLSSAPVGTYDLLYISGGPSQATLSSITPSATQSLYDGGGITFTLSFYSKPGTVTVQATLDDADWSGKLQYTFDNPSLSHYETVPATFSGAPTGRYTLTYLSDGPTNHEPISISPSATQVLSAGGSVVFTLKFISDKGTVQVDATLDGKPWTASGILSYRVLGPYTVSGDTAPGDTAPHTANATVPSTECDAVPYEATDEPLGMYTLTYDWGGPISASLVSITPGSAQSLTSGGQTIKFSMNFVTRAKGAVKAVQVKATLDGKPWEGAVRFSLGGPCVYFGDSVPDTVTDCGVGSYTLSFNSGGPPRSVLSSITPSPLQHLPVDGTLTFTLNFRSQRGD